MLREQDGLCDICRKASPTAIDHDHDTGKVRALLCNRCNTGIGMLGDDPEVLRAAANYIERHKP